jgi:hypothetical protein
MCHANKLQKPPPLESFHIRRYSGEGILAEGRGRGGIGRRVTGTGTHELPSFGNLAIVARLYCCLSEIMGN